MTRQSDALKTFVALKRTTDNFFKRVKADIKCHGLTVNEFAVLEVLYNKGAQPIQQIKEKILIASSSTTYVIDSLEKRNYVVRTQDPSDKRTYYASLTEKGYQLIDSVFPSHAQMIESCFQDLDDTSLTQLRESLKTVSTRVSK